MCGDDDAARFTDMAERAVREHSDFLEKDAVCKFFLAKVTSNAPTCLLLAHWMAKSMIRRNDTDERDIEIYGRIVYKMLTQLEINTATMKMMPEWFVGLTEKCLQGKIVSADEILMLFDHHGAEYQLHYCKKHQGIPLVIANHEFPTEIRIYNTTPTREALTIDDSVILPENVLTLDRERLRHMVNYFVATSKEAVVTREKYDRDLVIVHRYIDPDLPHNARIRDLPGICKYINLRLRLHSEYINPVLGIIDQDESAPCLVMEDNTTTSLLEYLGDTIAFKKYSSWTKKLRIARDIATGLKYLHDNGVVHKRLNPFTVLMTENLSVKLTCFGMDGEDQTTHASGVKSPELCRYVGHSFASDVFDFGLILMELIGYHVRDGAALNEVLSTPSIIASCPRWYEQLIRLCTMTDPRERLCVDDIVAELDKHLKDCTLDAPKDYVALVELDKTRVVQTNIAYSNDVINVYDGKYGDKDVWVKRPNDAQSNRGFSGLHHLLNDAMISLRVASEDIAHVYGIIEINSTSPGVVFEKMNLGSLNHFISRIEDKNSFDDTSKLHIAICVAQALLDLHEMDYVHCHVHTQSVFLSSNNKVALNDLILSQPADVLLSDYQLEHVQCLAPEVKAGHAFSKAADVYAFGKLLICLDLCKEETSDEDVASSEWCQSLAVLCCDENLQNRPTMRKIIKLLKRLKRKESPNFLNVMLRGGVSLSNQLGDLTVINGRDIEYREVIGSGAFGAIQRGIHNDNDVAIKVFKNDFQTDLDKVQMFAQEALNLHRCQSSENVVKMNGICLQEHQMVMELMDGDLGQYISQQSQYPAYFTWKMRLKIALQMAKAIADVHKHGVVHLGIKSFNFLYRQSGDGLVVKLCDFGGSRLIEEWGDEKHSNAVADLGTVGTPGWKAPEIISKRVHIQDIKKVDIYSLGVIFFELDSLELPLARNQLTPLDYERKTLHGELKLQFSDNCPVEFKRLAAQCLCFNPSLRPTADQVVGALQELLSANYT